MFNLVVNVMHTVRGNHKGNKYTFDGNEVTNRARTYFLDPPTLEVGPIDLPPSVR